MGSCLSSESRRPGIPGFPVVRRKRKNSKKKRCYWRSSFNSRRDETSSLLSTIGATEFASLYTQQGKKGTNQDAMVVWENFGSREDTIFCGVFDGHGPYGHMVARRVRDQLPLKLCAHWEAALKSDDVVRELSLNSISKNSEDASFASAEEESRPSIDLDEPKNQPDVFQTLKDSFLKAFKAMDQELRVHRSIDCFCSGTTAVTLVKRGADLFVGHVGDSRAVLTMRNEDNSLNAVQLTVDLKPNLPAEAERITRCKGRVFALDDEPEVVRVWLPDHDAPGLAMARAFGDFCLKDYGLISVPEVSHRRLTERDEFIVLATDGIWDVLTNQEVVEIVASAPNRDSAAKVLVESAVQAWRTKYPTSKVDDCAVVCLFLNTDRTTSVSSSPGNLTKEKKHLIASNQADRDRLSGLGHSGTIGTVKDILPYTSDDELSNDKDHQPHSLTDWSALEGVTRVNTMLTLPRFLSGKSGKKAFAETKPLI